jgi:hypothetical protein
MIVIDEMVNEAVKTNEPKRWLKTWVAREIEKNGDKAVLGIDGEFVTKENIDWHFEQIDDECESGGEEIFTGFLVCEDYDAGSEGIAVGFCSSDRAPLVFQWPEGLTEEEFLGNGDPTVYAITPTTENELVVKGETKILPAN